MKLSKLKVNKTFVKDPDVLWTVLIIDPLAIPLTYLLAKFPIIAPNLVSVVSLFFGILAAFLFSLGRYEFLIWGGATYEISYLLDCIDGKLARLTGRETLLGKKIEFIRDKVTHISVLIGITWGQYFVQKNYKMLSLAIIYFVVLFIYWIFYRSPLLKRWPLEKPVIIGRTSLFPSSVEAAVIAFFIGPLFNQVAVGILIAVILLVVLLLWRFLFLALGLSKSKINAVS